MSHIGEIPFVFLTCNNHPNPGIKMQLGRISLCPCDYVSRGSRIYRSERQAFRILNPVLCGSLYCGLLVWRTDDPSLTFFFRSRYLRPPGNTWRCRVLLHESLHMAAKITPVGVSGCMLKALHS